LLPTDFRDILSIFNDERVEYLLIGGYAVAAHGNPRATKDIDIWVRCSPDNADRILRALVRFGAPTTDLTADDFQSPGTTVQIGVPPHRIDLVTEIDGVQFDEAVPNRISVEIAGLPVAVIGRSDLIRNKKTTGRPQDLADVDSLGS
jgi:hypothetical protein